MKIELPLKGKTAEEEKLANPPREEGRGKPAGRLFTGKERGSGKKEKRGRGVHWVTM